MEKKKNSYTKFELLKYYISIYKLYRLERKSQKYQECLSTVDKKYNNLKLALQAGFFSAKKFNEGIIKAEDSMIRLQKLAGIQK